MYGRRRSAARTTAVKMFAFLGGLLFVISLKMVATALGSDDTHHHRHSTATRVGGRHLLSTNDTLECMPAAIEQFPRPFIFTHEQRVHGAIVLHIISTIVLFAAISIVCEQYFVPACQIMSSRLEMQSDVAGATFMAAGSSAPELATSVIGVFVAKDDIALGSVVGSSVFNVLLVISFTAIFAGKVVKISWWPLMRDCVFFTIGIIVLIIIIIDKEVHWYEASVLLLLYAVYILTMFYNDKLESFFRPGIPGVVCCRRKDSCDDSSSTMSVNEKSDLVHTPSKQVDTVAADTSTCGRVFYVAMWPLYTLFKCTIPDCRTVSIICTYYNGIPLQVQASSPFFRFKNYYLLSFLMSIAWIGAFSYLMVWMISLIGYTFSIPDTVMALTLIAAGGSIPDLIASVIVVREGYGDMAVSNALGSNVFDIFMCLGIPWFLSTVLVDRTHVTIYSGGLTNLSLGLLLTVALLVAATHLNGWKLTKRYGYVLLVGYILYNTLACLYELNVFTYVNPTTCVSDY